MTHFGNLSFIVFCLSDTSSNCTSYYNGLLCHMRALSHASGRTTVLVLFDPKYPISVDIFLGKVTNGRRHISTTRGGTSQNSSDLSLGRRPESKFVEFCEVPPLVG